MNAIVDAVRSVLERTPPELAADIVDKGVVLSGGGAQLKNLDVLLREETGLPVMVCENPQLAVVLGTTSEAWGDLFSGFQDKLSPLVIVGARPAMGKCVAWDTPILDPTTGAMETAAEVHRG